MGFVAITAAPTTALAKNLRRLMYTDFDVTSEYGILLIRLISMASPHLLGRNVFRGRRPFL
jgi:hypothetical protein